MENNQTALQSFWNKIALKLSVEQINEFLPEFEQAKAMEKEQMEDCWIAAHQAGRFEGKGIAQEDWQTFFNYYNETYNK